MSDDATGAIRALLADDQHLVRSGFSMILSVEPDVVVVGEAANGREAVEAAQRLRPDIVLMDVQMPLLDGIAATRQIVEADLGKVVILTTFDRDDYLFDGLDAGASGFLLKNADPDQLVEAIRAVAHGHALLAPEVTRRVIEARLRASASGTGREACASAEHRSGPDRHTGRAEGLASPDHAGEPDRHTGAAAPDRDSTPTTGTAKGAGSTGPSSRSGPPPGPRASSPPATDDLGRLTEREREVLVLVGRGLSNAEIARTLYVGEATVKTHVSNVLAKLHLRDRVQAVVHAYEAGLILPGE